MAITGTATGSRILLHVQPKASRTELAGRHGDALKLRVAAPPVDGAANEEVIRFLADRLGIPRHQLRIVSGLSSRRKTVAVDALLPAEVERSLGP